MFSYLQNRRVAHVSERMQSEAVRVDDVKAAESAEGGSPVEDVHVARLLMYL